MTTKIQKSKAKTAYGLLSDVAKLVLAEPRRMRMAQWRTPISTLPPQAVPECTVGCIGGWTEIIAPPAPLLHAPVARQILGIDMAQADELFFGHLCNDRDQGTNRHARRVVSLIRRFQKKNKAQLLAKKVHA